MSNVNKTEGVWPQTPGVSEKIAAMESRKGRNHPLEQMRAWLQEQNMALPDQAIQVAGTNGKGSVCVWLSLLLNEAGRSAGMFTSPHLVSHTERIQVDGVPVSLGEWEASYDRWQSFFEEQQMTMFEMDLWMALDAFAKRKPEWVIMEVGMGGERDATTALPYQAGVITHIGMDHMNWLGASKKEIARAKAGIMKPGMPVYCMERDPEVRAVFEEEAEKRNAKLIYCCNAPFPAQIVWRKDLPEYQKDNFLLALSVVKGLGISLNAEQLQEAVDRFAWPGRFQILRKDPLVVLDGAHNPDGIEALCRTLPAWQVEQGFFSVLADKQADEMIEDLLAVVPKLTLVEFDTPRLADLHELAAKHGLQTITMQQMEDRLIHAHKRSVVCGSLYFAGEVLDIFAECFMD